jgi:hypothetical protein
MPPDDPRRRTPRAPRPADRPPPYDKIILDLAAVLAEELVEIETGSLPFHNRNISPELLKLTQAADY